MSKVAENSSLFVPVGHYDDVVAKVYIYVYIYI